MSNSTRLELVGVANGTATLRITETLYPLDAVYGAAYVLIDAAYVMLGRDGEDIVVQLRAKANGDDQEHLRALAGTFSNALLSETLRQRVTTRHHDVLERIVAKALTGASGVASSGAFDDDDDLDFLDDPLGIAVPWEERFKKAGSEPVKSGPDAEKAASAGDAGGFTPTKPKETLQ